MNLMSQLWAKDKIKMMNIFKTNLVEYFDAMIIISFKFIYSNHEVKGLVLLFMAQELINEVYYF